MAESVSELAGREAGPRIVAHRGSSLRYRENTMAAFSGAAAEGADGLEFDVRSTSDGRLVVHHDPDLVDGRLISRTPAVQLPSDIPSLDEVLTLGDSLWLNVEIKNDRTEPDYDEAGRLARAVVDAVAGCQAAADDAEVDDEGGGTTGGIVISSFDPTTLQHGLAYVASADGPKPGGVGFGYLLWLDPDRASDVDSTEATRRAVEAAVELGCVAIHPHDPLVDQDLLDQAHAVGLAVNVWTVDDPDRIARLAEMGVDGIITNDPAGGLAALGRS